MRVHPIVILVCLGGAARAAVPCAPPPDVRDALLAIDDRDDDGVATLTAARRRLAALRPLLAAHPGDFHVLQRMATSYDELMDAAAFRAELVRARAAGLDEGAALALEAELLGADPKAAEAGYAAALAKSPGLAAAHLALARAEERAKHQTRARAHVLAALAACPDDPPGYEALARLHDDKLLAAQLKPWRARLERDPDPAHLPRYATWWDLSFKATPPARHPALRKQIAADLARLRTAVTSAPRRDLLEALATGYRLLGDVEGGRWVAAERERRFPDAGETMAAVMKAWDDAHPTKGVKTPADWRAYYGREVEQTRAWVKRWPTRTRPWTRHLAALRAGPRPALPEVEQAAAALRKLEPRRPLAIAEAYHHFGLHPELLVPIAEQALVDLDAELKSMQHAFGEGDAELVKMIADDVTSERLHAWDLLVRVHLAQGRRAAAEQLLPKMEQTLGPPLAADADPEAIDTRKSREATLFEAKGHVAMDAKHAADALAYFLHAAALSPSDDPPDPDEDDVRLDGERAWKALGGSPATLALLGAPTSKQDDGHWQKVDRPMATFELHDLAGKLWRLRDLKGRLVVLNAWATWCGPCQDELPEVEKLHRALAGSRDVVLVTLNLDDELGVVQPFMQAHGYTFPVLPAAGVVDTLLPKASGIPFSMVLDRKGQVRRQLVGFDGKAESWVDAAKRAVEETR